MTHWRKNDITKERTKERKDERNN